MSLLVEKQASRSSFLQLSPDIRLLIYQYLIPNLEIKSDSNYDSTSLRHDGQVCFPAILRVNRTIYNEAVYEWYGSSIYGATLRRYGAVLHSTWNSKADYSKVVLEVVRQRITLEQQMPPFFRTIRHLKLRIILQNCIEIPASASVMKDYAAMLTRVFPAGQDLGRLQVLTLEVVIDCVAFWGHKFDYGVLHSSLERDLGHFRNLRIPQFHTGIVLSKNHRSRHTKRCSGEIWRRPDVLRSTEKFLRDLRDEVTQSSDHVDLPSKSCFRPFRLTEARRTSSILFMSPQHLLIASNINMNLNQITVPVTSLSTSIDFYELLGLKLIVRSDPGYARFICSAGDSTFSLHRVDTPITGENGIWVYFEVEDVDKTVVDLEKTGVTIEEQPEDKSWLWREARIKDPDGNIVIIYRAAEMRKDPPWRLEASK